MSDKFKKLDSKNAIVSDYLQESLRIAEFQISLKGEIHEVYKAIIESLNSGGKILLCGNGGSASDSQHIAAELINRFKINRFPIPAIALTTDTSIITSIANDYGYDLVFSKQIQALGKEGDILIAISTSGKSKNILSALKIAKGIGMRTVSFTGENFDSVKPDSDMVISIPSKETGVVQQSHITILQVICGLVENSIN